MHPKILPRSIRIIAIIAGTMMVGAGVSDHASAQKELDNQGVGTYFSQLLSFSPINRNAGYIQAALNGTLDAGRIESVKFYDGAALARFYQDRNEDFLWVDSQAPTHPRAALALHLLGQSWTHGLNPETYHTSKITALMEAATPVTKAQLELLVSDGVARYARDLTGLRFSPKALNLDPDSWRQPIGAYDALTRIAQSGAAGIKGLEKGLDDFAPKDTLYNHLRQEFIALAGSADRAQEASLPVILKNGILRPGDFDNAVPVLRARLGLVHDPLYGAERRYDDPLAAAVMAFQRRNGLSADGAVGPKTLDVLNRTNRQKMEQLAVNMERLRWLSPEKPDKYILVNIPSATLWAVEDGDVAAMMPVIVGRPDRPTKSFITEISGMRFNPKWTVPPTIKARDFLPRLVEDPYYLYNKGIEVSRVVDGVRHTLDSTAIDWSAVSRRDLQSLRMVQRAGDDNALGRYRVLMENRYDIYLHDTNTPSLFSKPDRAISSGCIRMAKPDAIARFILHGNKGWDDQRMSRILDSGKTSEVSAEERIKVYILYLTVWQDDEGKLVYGPDVYKQDRKLLDHMKAQGSYHIPDVQAVKYAVGTPSSIVQ